MADTVAQWIFPATRMKYTTVSTPPTQVMIVCSRMIVSNPSAALPTMSTVMIRKAITLVAVPALQCSCANTVAVASVASAVSTISQPTLSIHETSAGSLFPCTPNAARDSTSVGADPRLPATAMKPTSRNETTIPISPATQACQKEMPKPSTYA